MAIGWLFSALDSTHQLNRILVVSDMPFSANFASQLILISSLIGFFIGVGVGGLPR
jgi:hypothetical protein